MFGDSTDLPNFALLAAGVDPETSTEDDWRRPPPAGEAAKDGIVRDYYLQNYMNALRPRGAGGVDGLVRRHVPGEPPGAADG